MKRDFWYQHFTHNSKNMFSWRKTQLVGNILLTWIIVLGIFVADMFFKRHDINITGYGVLLGLLNGQAGGVYVGGLAADSYSDSKTRQTTNVVVNNNETKPPPSGVI
jgi:hypothetical protein